MIKIPIRMLNSFPLTNLLKTKIHYNFSSQNHEHLNQSEFSKELGLQGEYKKLVKIQKSNEKTSFRFSATGFVIISMIIGGYVLIRVIDSNQRKLLQYKFKKWSNSFILNKKQRQEMSKNLSIDHENNLKQIYEKSYKNRSNISVKFLKHLQNDIENKMSQNNQISTALLEMTNQIREKFESTPQERIAKTKNHFLSILEKILYHQLRNSKQNENIIPKGSQNVVINFAKFLLKKGDLNNQLLGLKFLKQRIPHESLLMLISKEEVEIILQRVEVNNKTLQASIKVGREVQQKVENDSDNKLFWIKEQIVYSMPQLKVSREIRKKKVNMLREQFRRIAREQKRR